MYYYKSSGKIISSAFPIADMDEISREEYEAMMAAVESEIVTGQIDSESTPDDRLTALEAENKELKDQTKMLTECILEMSEIIYAE